MTNICIITGRLVRDPELRQTNSDKAVASFTLANDYGKTSSGEKKTAFIDCVAWGRQAEFVKQYFTKGKGMTVTGTLTTRTWEKDGQKRKAVELEAREIDFPLTERSGGTDKSTAFTDIDPDDDEELPF